MGADHTAALPLGGFFEDDHVTVLVDIGTNTEISLRLKGESFLVPPLLVQLSKARIFAMACACYGAVDDVTFTNGEWHVSTIDERPAVGICGTGILNAVSALLDAGAINSQGRLINNSPRTKMENNPRVCVAAEIRPKTP